MKDILADVFLFGTSVGSIERVFSEVKYLLDNHNNVYIFYMKYNVYVAPTTDPELLGIEIQPPISDMAFSGIKKVLTHPAYGPVSTGFVELTRNDVEGTAFTLGYDDVSAVPEGEAPFSLPEVAQQIAGLLNPAGLHEVQLHFPES